MHCGTWARTWAFTLCLILHPPLDSTYLCLTNPSEGAVDGTSVALNIFDFHLWIQAQTGLQLNIRGHRSSSPTSSANILASRIGTYEKYLKNAFCFWVLCFVTSYLCKKHCRSKYMCTLSFTLFIWCRWMYVNIRLIKLQCKRINLLRFLWYLIFYDWLKQTVMIERETCAFDQRAWRSRPHLS